MILEMYKKLLMEFLNTKESEIVYAEDLMKMFTEFLTNRNKTLLHIHNMTRFISILKTCNVTKLPRTNKGFRYFIGEITV